MIKKYPAEILEIENLTEGVYTLRIKSLRSKFKFYPGQFLHLALDEYDPSEPWPESRCFSIQTAPGTKEIKITFSVKGAFTEKMAQTLTRGSILTLKLPYGDLFTQEHNKDRTVFIAGGTGITPFLSLFAHESFKDYQYPVLFAGFRNSSLNVYENEIKSGLTRNNSFRHFIKYEDTEGYIEIEDLIKHARVNSSFYISGPPEMIKYYKKELIKSNINENQIYTDDWE